ncbi:L-serine ammonia-lyase [Sphingomonas hankookensis]|uniref:L-serine ammonia-lyase n=1 Tax=Sphingomonas hankookensis TaxID=563996 RepID=UPI003D303612
MRVSVFDLFKPGIGPSSSHTMGPMIAAGRFLAVLRKQALLPIVHRVEVTLYGSLAMTGRGHATDRAAMLGLMGFLPHAMDPDAGDAALADLAGSGAMALGGTGPRIAFDPVRDIVWQGFRMLPRHANALAFAAHDASAAVLIERTYYSIGGGFVVNEGETDSGAQEDAAAADLPYPFASAAQLLDICDRAGRSIAAVMMANECSRRPLAEVEAGLDAIHAAMDACIARGLRTDGILPGGLAVPRRAPAILRAKQEAPRQGRHDPFEAMDMVNLWAMAVNEENAAGGRVVTAPTNGSAGLLPAVLRYVCHYLAATPEQIRVFLLTAAAIGALYKTNASISGAEVGCQGEVGVACSMAAAGLCAVMGGSNAQIENAAEIGMEHNLGLTCDPIGGLVQIPCIERNAMGAVKAIDAARLAMLGDGRHHVSLDAVIATMKRTGADMDLIYKETSLGGLAVSLVEC